MAAFPGLRCACPGLFSTCPYGAEASVFDRVVAVFGLVLSPVPKSEGPDSQRPGGHTAAKIRLPRVVILFYAPAVADNIAPDHPTHGAARDHV